MRTGAFFLWVMLNALSSAGALAASAQDNYKKLCASCHGDYMQGGSAPSLRDDTWSHGGSSEQIIHAILQGIAPGMPAFKEALSLEDARALVIYMRESRYYANNQKARMSRDQVFESLGETFSLEPVVTGMDDLWGMDFFPDGGVIFTHKKGALYTQAVGANPVLIQGTPSVWYAQQAGMLDVKLHPDYEKNAWIYLSFAEKNKQGGMTRIVRGRILENRWVDQQDIYLAPSAHYWSANGHFGSRFVFHDGYVYFSVGDRRKHDGAQSLETPNGKVHRLHDDGRIPKDNPFVSVKGAVPSIYTFGNRNPQGLTLQPKTGLIWEAEHGPRGGDEINLIERGVNYGWPMITYGMNYNGTPWTSETAREGMEQPKHYWVPSIAVSQIDFYEGQMFPKWQGKLMVASLAKQELRLLSIEDRSVIADDLLFKNLGRMRDIHTGPAGEPHVIFVGKKGGIYKLVRDEKK